jgi:hypothetical protein
LPQCIDQQHRTITASEPIVIELVNDAIKYFQWLIDQFRECWRILDYI